MHNKSTYEFAVIRLVPKVEREEFLNIGVILFSKPLKYLDMKFLVDENKLKAFSTEIEASSIIDYLNSWKLICEGGVNAGKIGELDLPSRFRWLTSARSTIIQSSPVHPGICEYPEKILQDLFELYVL